jgi:hypothetical protein
LQSGDRQRYADAPIVAREPASALVADEGALIDVGVASPARVGDQAGCDDQHGKDLLEALAKIVEAERGQNQERRVEKENMPFFIVERRA